LIADSKYSSQKKNTSAPVSIVPNSSPPEFLTKEGLIDELVFCLGSFNSYNLNELIKEIEITHKYYDRAEWLIYRINVFNPIPEFEINLSDLSFRLKREIADLVSTPVLLDDVMTNVVRRLLESVDPSYYHLAGIHGKIRWRLVP